MDKEELFDLIVKGFGVCFLVLAIIAIPKALEGIFTLLIFIVYNPWAEAYVKSANFAVMLRSGVIVQGVGGIIRFVLYIIASINFLRTGSWVRKLMGR